MSNSSRAAGRMGSDRGYGIARCWRQAIRRRAVPNRFPRCGGAGSWCSLRGYRIVWVSLRAPSPRLEADVETHLARTANKPHIAVARGPAALLQQALDLTDAATTRIDVGASAGTVAPLQGALRQAESRGVRVTYYCFNGCPPPGCGLCRNPVPAAPGPFEMHGWLTVVADEDRVLMATEALQDPEILTTDLPPLAAALKTLFRRADGDQDAPQRSV